jgi:hypothetical protein
VATPPPPPDPRDALSRPPLTGDDYRPDPTEWIDDDESACHEPAGPGVQVTGRHLRAPVVRITLFSSRVVVQVDDGRQPDQWIHLHIDAETLRRWVVRLEPDPDCMT